jgi:hypothetical protein
MNIRQLFDPNKNIDRSIEKVITYGASQENRLKAEISEYVVTDSIEEQMVKLLEKMQLAMDSGGENEIGVWVSGFYGSGKSSFTKYLGFAFDQRVTIDGVPFVKHLQDRLHTAQAKALLSTVVTRFPAAVVMLDLAAEMLAGATMEDVSTVLYYKVLNWAGYSRNLKIAALERRLEKDGRYDEFVQKVELAVPGVSWKDLQNDPLVVDSLIPELAHELYPALFPNAGSFSSSTDGFVTFEDQRVEEMINIIRKKSGKEHIIFVVDEVGQYISSRDNLILNLDGLAKNLKRLGDGKVWIMSTAQQTLTEDDPSAALNSEKLYKLKDRFPIQVDLEASDIKEICYKRLLGKSPAGEAELGGRFDLHGQALRHNTRLQDAKYYDSEFDRTAFVNLYPFLPAHFEILLHLLGALAKSTGGVGLRSAIKVIQDILVEGADGRTPAGDQQVGWLATTVTLFDALERDIKRAFVSKYQAFEKVRIRFPDSQLHQDIGKTIAVLQILSNMPVTRQNVASLMHPAIDQPSRLDEISKAIDELLNDPSVPLTERDGHLSFLSEKLREIEEQRGQIVLRQMDVQRIFSEALRSCFDPLPKATLHSTFTVTSGVKLQSGTGLISLAGERDPVQTVVKFAKASDYETERAALIEESRHKTEQNNIFLLCRSSDELQALAEEIYRCKEIARKYSTEPDSEVKDYCENQSARAEDLTRNKLSPGIKKALAGGSFIFRGQPTAVTALDPELGEAAKKILSSVAEQVFDRYGEAPVRVETGVAEKFLRLSNLNAVTSALDPLGLVEISGGTPRIKSSQKAIVSIRDFIDRNGAVYGKSLLDYFGEAPFGWSKDTTRYILAAMLIGGELKLKVSGREVTARGQQAIDALKTNNSFATIGVSRRIDQPDIHSLSRAAERLTALTGEMVVPLEDEISAVTTRTFPRFQQEYSPLSEKLAALSVAGVERVRTLNQDLADILTTDGSDATERLGGERSSLYENLVWAGELKHALAEGLASTIRELQEHRKELDSLPGSGIPGQLCQDLSDELALIKQRLVADDFYLHLADLNSSLTTIKSRVRDAVVQLKAEQKNRLTSAGEDLQRLPEWTELTQEEQSNALAVLEGLAVDAPENLSGLKQLIARDYDINTRSNDLKERIRAQGQERVRQRIEDERKKKGANDEPVTLVKTVPVPASVRTVAELDELIRLLQELKAQAALYSDLEVTLTLEV